MTREEVKMLTRRGFKNFFRHPKGGDSEKIVGLGGRI